MYNASMENPQKFGRYEIVEELGRGGMATVYRAFDPRFKREVALKLLPRQFTHDPMFRARFEREAETIAALEHPAIVPVYDFGERDDQPYLVMRLMTGGSLVESISQGPMSIADCAKVLARIGAALDRAHEMGIVHRDLKPGNILFDQYGDAFLADFGIARIAQGAATLTGSGVIGTPAYMSPEQIQGGTIDGRTDVYALGIILFEMLTGQKPYAADTPAMIMVKQMTEPVPHILDVKPDLPPYIESLLSQAMAKEMADRYVKASDISRTLETLSGSQAQTTVELTRKVTQTELPVPPAQPSDDQPTPAAGKRLPWRRLAAGAAVLAAAALILWLAIDASSPDEPEESAAAGAINTSQVQTAEESAETEAGGIPPVPQTAADSSAQMAPLRQLGNGTVDSIALSPNGQLAAVAGSLGVWIYDTAEWQVQRLLTGHQDAVSGVTWSPDGSRLATSSWDQTIRFWDAFSGEQTGIISGDEQFTAVAWSPDGTTLASASWEYEVQLWNTDNGKHIADLAGHDDWVDELAWSPDGAYLASAGGDGTVRIWDSAGFSEQAVLPSSEDEILCLAWGPDSSQLAVCDETSSTVQIWTVDDESQPSYLLEGQEWGVFDVAWSPDGSQLVSAGGDNTIRLWQAGSGMELELLKDIQQTVDHVIWYPDGEQIVFSGSDSSLRVLDVGSRELLHQLETHSSSVFDLAWSPDGSLIGSANSDTNVRIWDAGSGDMVQLLQGHEYGVYSVDWSPDGKVLSSSGDDGTVRFWDTESWWQMGIWEMDEDAVSTLAWSPNGGLLAAGDITGRFHLFDFEADNVAAAWPAHQGYIYDVAWSPDVGRLATSSDRGEISIWQPSDGQLMRQLEGHEDSVAGLSWSPDGLRLASASFDHTVRIWDMESGDTVHILPDHHELVAAVAWSPDGQRIASAGWDNQIRLWDANSGRPLQAMAGHVAAVVSLAWSPDGDRLASGSEDGTIIIWGWAP